LNKFTKSGRKDTTFFLYVQVRAYNILKKMHFQPQSGFLSTFNFQLSTFFCTFAPDFA